MRAIRFARGLPTRRQDSAVKTSAGSPMIETLECRRLCAADAGHDAAVAVAPTPAAFVGPLPADAYAALMKANGHADEATSPSLALGNDAPLPEPAPRPVRFWSSTGGNDGGTGGWLRTEYRNLSR
jgi:hypothetical protein